MCANRIKRDSTADLLKGFAVLFMIQVHLMEQFVTADTYNSLIGKISMFLGGPFCAPVFLAVMGYYLAFSSRNLAYFLKRGILLFMGGVLLNMARSANLLIQILRGQADLDPWFYILGADILTLAGLSLMLTGILRMVFRERLLLFFLTTIAVVVISPYLNQIRASGFSARYILAFLWGTEEWSYFPLFPWVAYVLSGYSFRLLLQQPLIAGKINIQNQLIFFIPLIVAVVATIPYAAEITYHLPGPGGYYHHGILFFGWVILFMMAWLILMKLTDIYYGDQRFVRLIKWTGQKVTSLYVIQWLIIGNIATILFRSQDLFHFIGWFFAVTITTLLMGFLAGKVMKV